MANEQAVKFGISNAYYAIYNETEGTYGTPKRLPGAVSMSLSREGSESKFYADNVVFYQMSTNAGYSGDFVLSMTPESVYTDLLGQVKDKNGVLVESSDDKQVTFALLYEVDGNAYKQRFAMYNCTLSRPSTEAKTKEDTTTPDTDTLNISMISREITWGSDKKNVVKASVKDSTATKTQYEGWFTQVYIPEKPTA